MMDKVPFNFVMHFENVIFDYLKYDSSEFKEAFVINLIIVLVKFYIH